MPALDEGLEDVRPELLRQPDPVIAHPYDRVAVHRLGAHPNVAAGRRVLVRVGEEIVQDLVQPVLIALDGERFRRQRPDQFLTSRLGVSRGGDHDLAEHVAQVQGLALHLHRAANDPRGVHEVVQEARHVRHLPVRHLAATDQERIGRFSRLPQVDVGRDGRQRVAQFVRQHRQEIVLLPARGEQ